MRRQAAWTVATLVAATLVTAAPAQAEERVCRNRTFGAITVDNLRVPDGATCTLNGTRVKGTIKVESRATLRAYGVRVVGNVQGENARLVVVREGSVIGGSVQLVQGGGARIVRNRITGDLYFDDNRRAIRANRNRIGGNLEAFQNTGGVSINHNRIDGNLQCKENDPPPVGGGNVVQGNKEDQCARL